MKKILYILLISFIMNLGCKKQTSNANQSIKQTDSVVKTEQITIDNTPKQDTLPKSEIEDSVVVSKVEPIRDTIKKEKLTVKKKEKIECPVFKNFNIPSPSKFKYAAKKTKPAFDALYPINTANKLSTTYQKSVALGIYSADLVYSAFYNNSNLVEKYFNLAVKISDNLGIPGTFSAQDLDFIQNNINNDTIKIIIRNAIENTCINLNQSKTYTELPFVIYGGWLESVYLLSKTIIENQNSPKFLYKQLSKQGITIDNLIKFYNNILLDAEDYEVNLNVQNIIGELNSIKDIFGNNYNSNDYIIDNTKIQEINKKLNDIRIGLNQENEKKVERQQMQYQRAIDK